jgi:hypothetical protein
MHDTQVEDRLRRILRNEGEDLPFTITTAELERRLAARRRAAGGRRLSLVAAVVAAIAVGGMVAVSNGWVTPPGVATQPGPTPTPTVAPTTSATPTYPADRIREANPLGSATEAVLVRPVGDASRPDAFQVTRVDPLASTTTVIGTIPGSVLPADAEMAGGRVPVVSETGWLALPIIRNAGSDSSFPALVVVDLTDLSLPPATFDHVDSASWDTADGLILANGGRLTFGVPGFGQVIPSEPVDAGINIVHAPHLGGPLTSVTEGSRFIGTAGTGKATVWGAVGYDGTFRPTNNLPAIYQRSGIERPTGVAAHTLTVTCDKNGTVVTTSCDVVEQDATRKPVRNWLTGDGVAGVFDAAWAVDGKGVWLLLDSGSSAGQLTSVLIFASSPGTGEGRSIDLPPIGSVPTILGIDLETAPGQAEVVAIGDDAGYIRAFVAADGSVRAQDGTAWFAGWAGRQEAYDPD